MANWVKEKILGKGSYGAVFLAKQQPIELDLESDLRSYFAVKVAPLRNSFSLWREEQILKHFLECPEIVQCLGSEITLETSEDSLKEDVFYNLKLEYAAGGTLSDLIKRQTKLLENEVKEYLRMILRGLSSIHRERFVHVDLKPENILVFPENDGTIKLKIADFGLSKICGEMDVEGQGVASFRGTPKYMSPESIIFSEVNTALDIWSLGCIMVMMVSGKSVWSECKSREELMTKLLDDMEIPEIPRELSEEGNDFIRKCFERLHKQRWTADMLLKHHYLKEEEEKVAMKKGDETLFLPHGVFKSKTQSSNYNGISQRQKKHYLPHLLCNIKSRI